MNLKNVTGPIMSIQLHEMCELVHSYVSIKHSEGNTYNNIEEYGTIDELCLKYKLIKRQNGLHDGSHHIGRKCVVFLRDGQTMFERYY